MRLFFGIWPPPEVSFVLSELAVRIRALSGGRAIPAPNIHLTLTFFGEVAPERVSAAIEAAHRARKASEPGALRLAEVRFKKRNAIVWAAPTTIPEEVVALAARLRAELEAAGFALEARAFAPHVTLVRKARAADPLAVLPDLDWPVTEFVLARSDQTAEGAAYTPLERFAL